MFDFAERVAASKKFPSLLFRFKAFDPTVRIYDVTTPECMKLAVVRTIYSVVLRLNFVSHRIRLQREGVVGQF